MGGTAAVFVLLTVALYLVARVNFLAFHTLAETFAIVVSSTAFAVAWYSRRWIGSGYLLMLGISQVFVALLDVVHTLTYEGMRVIPGTVFDTSLQFWLLARLIEAAAFAAAFARPLGRFPVGMAFAGFGAASAAGLALIASGMLPPLHVDGRGLTPFKIGAEYAVIALLLLALLALARKARHVDAVVRRLLVMAVLAKIGSELCFTLYVDPYGIASFTGHVFKIVFAFLLLRALVETGLTRPQAMVFGSIEREKGLADELRRHAGTLDAVLDSSLDPVTMVGADGRFRFVSRAAETFFGRPSSELCERTWVEAGLDEAVMGPLEALCGRVAASLQPVTEELTVLAPDGRRWLEVQASPVHPEAGRAEAVVLVLRDITVRKTMEDSLKASLADNRALVQEVHHRVKNNLQIVSSILQMQGWRLADPEMRNHFEEACGRILSLAKVHEMLHKQDSASSIEFVRYVRALCDELLKMYGVRPDWVHLSIRPGSLPLDLDLAVPLGLMIHELVTNAIKHAFTEHGGELTVVVEAAGDRGRMVVEDDGKGLGGARIGEHAATLGMRMVASLSKQVHGTLAVQSPPPGRTAGTRIEIEFPLAPCKPASADMSLLI